MNAHAEVELESWQATGHPLTIEYDAAVLNEIRTEAIDGLNRLSRGGLEIGGVLFGRKDGDRITILSHRPLACEYALGPSFTLSPKDELAMEQLLASPSLLAVGWYHSHTRSGILLSEKDMQIFNRFFPEPWQIALVVRPHRFDPTVAGFFFREPNGIRTQSSYCEFTVKSPAVVRAAPPAVIPVRQPQAVQTELPAPRPAHGKPERGRWTFVAGLAAAAALTAGLSFFYAYAPRAASDSLALRVFDTGGQLRIDWDRDAATVRRAESAVLEISDDGQKRRDALDMAQLRTGSVTYVRSSGDIVVRLRVISADRRALEETARFIGPAVRIAEAAPAGSADRVAVENHSTPRRVSAAKPIPRSLLFAADSLPQAPVLLASAASPPTELAPPQALAPPSTGTIVWTGSVAAPATLEIRHGHATPGSITGRLPGQPVKVTLASQRGGQIQIAEFPGPQNSWDGVVLRVESGEPTSIVLHWELAANR
jgi:proteasome lid subunit RPN8/RPN11